MKRGHCFQKKNGERNLSPVHAYPGMGRQPGYLRSHIAAGNCTSSDCIVEVPVADYARKWNLSLSQYQVHCRYLLIDTLTGYRCNYRKTSFLLSKTHITDT